MRGTSQNTEKPTTPAGEEVETVYTAEDISTRITRISRISTKITRNTRITIISTRNTRITRITRISNFRDQNSEGKIPELQIQNATAVEGLDTTRISASFVLRHSAHSAKYKATS